MLSFFCLSVCLILRFSCVCSFAANHGNAREADDRPQLFLFKCVVRFSFCPRFLRHISRVVSGWTERVIGSDWIQRGTTHSIQIGFGKIKAAIVGQSGRMDTAQWSQHHRSINILRCRSHQRYIIGCNDIGKPLYGYLSKYPIENKPI